MKQTFNVELIRALAKKYKISTRYVRYCLNGERSPCFAEKIKNDYRKYIDKIENVIEHEMKTEDSI